jgi:tetratricopeptide (TPR) repeat protein
MTAEPGAGAERTGSATLRRALGALVVLGVLLVYAGVGSHEFVNYDDDRYVTANDVVQGGLTAEGIGWALTAKHASNWHPLTWTSHMLDVSWYGLEAGAHKRTSVLVHALAALLLYLALAGAAGRPWPAFLAAALFAWHPLRVESVAWVAERKDVLSGLFAFLTLWLHVGYARRGGALRYVLVLVALALGLAAKPMLVTLPFVLLLFDRWPLERREPLVRLAVEKLPHLALAAASSWMTLVAQRASGATELLGDLPFALRLENALASLGVYVGQTLWPSGLACLYPHAALLPGDPGARLAVPALLGGLLLILASAGALLCRRRTPAVLCGWLWTLGTLVPVAGLVQVGFQAHADRYTYLPSVGLGLLVAYSLAELVRARPRLRPLVAGASGLALAALALTAARQVDTWRDSETLWTHCLDVSEENFVAHNNLGRIRATAQDLDAARFHFEAAVRLRPGTPPDRAAAETHANLGAVLALQGEAQAAMDAFKRATELDDEDAEAHAQLGRLMALAGRDAGSVQHLARALDLAPARLEVRDLLAAVLATSRDPAVRDGARAVALARPLVKAGVGAATMAAAQAEVGDFQKAVRWQTQALQSAPVQLRQEMEKRLASYRAAKPWRKSP